MKNILKLLKAVHEAVDTLWTGEEPENPVEAPSLKELSGEVVSTSKIVLPLVSSHAAVAIGLYDMYSNPQETLTISGLLSLGGIGYTALGGSLSIAEKVIVSGPAGVNAAFDFCANSLPSLITKGFFSRPAQMISKAAQSAIEVGQTIEDYLLPG